jgi:two-component system, chemotaxis family, chemotaxis protein CheY
MPDETFSTITVMVVDDEDFMRKFVARALAEIGVRNVVTAQDGIDALAQLDEPDSAVDIVICDIEMPEMTGYEFVRRIRFGTIPRFKGLPVLILTGQDTEVNMRKAKIYKINGFLLKPPRIDALRDEMSKILGL